MSQRAELITRSSPNGLPPADARVALPARVRGRVIYKWVDWLRRLNWLRRLRLIAALLFLPLASHAGNQQYEPLAASVRLALAAAVADKRPPEPRFNSIAQKIDWLTEMSMRLQRRMPDALKRQEFLLSVYYESQRAGLDPELVLGLIQVESGFRRYAVSGAGAIGYMQVMPFWTRLLGQGQKTELFDMRTNLRYGCVILRHYLDIEKGDLYRALGRYNGSLGQPQYPYAVHASWKKWQHRYSPISQPIPR